MVTSFSQHNLLNLNMDLGLPLELLRAGIQKVPRRAEATFSSFAGPQKPWGNPGAGAMKAETPLSGGNLGATASSKSKRLPGQQPGQ